jgi:uncharacterized membrane protein
MGFAFITIAWPGNRHLTFSQHVARRKTSILFYILLFSATLPLLSLFFLEYFTDKIGAPIWLNAIILLSAITQYACTYIPEIGGIRSTLHRILAGISGIALIPALVIIELSSTVLLDSLFCLIGLAVMLDCICITVLAKGKPQNALLLQTFYFAGFFIPVLFIEYL